MAKARSAESFEECQSLIRLPRVDIGMTNIGRILLVKLPIRRSRALIRGDLGRDLPCLSEIDIMIKSFGERRWKQSKGLISFELSTSQEFNI